MPRNFYTNKIKAFTLAEVLIVLAIIGIIAALTIPTLLSKSRNLALQSALQKEYSTFANATQQVLMNEYGGSYQDLNSDNVSNLLSNYLKYLAANNCPANSTCSAPVLPKAVNLGFGDYVVANYKTINGYASYPNCVSDVAIALNDGAFAILDRCMTDNPFVLTIDVNGWQHKPNQFAHDFFQFQILNGKLVPMGIDGTIFPESVYCSTLSSDPYNGRGCTAKAFTDKDFFTNLP